MPGRSRCAAPRRSSGMPISSAALESVGEGSCEVKCVHRHERAKRDPIDRSSAVKDAGSERGHPREEQRQRPHPLRARDHQPERDMRPGDPTGDERHRPSQGEDRDRHHRGNQVRADHQHQRDIGRLGIVSRWPRSSAPTIATATARIAKGGYPFRSGGGVFAAVCLQGAVDGGYRGDAAWS